MENNRNFVTAMVLCAAVFFAWYFAVGLPQERAEEQRQAQLAHQVKKEPSLATPGAPQMAITPEHLSHAQALKQDGPRIAIDTPSVDGSLLLKGARFDDLRLRKYHLTVDDKSPEIVLLSPKRTDYPYYADFGWSSTGAKSLTPNDSTPWKLIHGSALSPGKPVVLQWDNGHGLVFTRTIAVDDQYMFTVADQVANKSGAKAVLAPYASVVREGVPKTQHFWVLHEGFVGMANNSAQYTTYDSLKPDEPQKFDSTGGWLGITDKYWMASVIPPQNEHFSGGYSVNPLGNDKAYQSDYLLAARTLQPGATLQVTQHLFAGAKVVNILKGYEANLGITRFEMAIDWGWFRPITQPLFWVLDQYYHFLGNFGLAILLLTVTVKLLFFPLANTSFRSMSRMKKVQPEMERLRKLHADDPAKQQQELMELYRREKVNPLAGCLPMLIQIPVFFSLYKVLFVTIEMRHAPFVGWIKDLSAPDPTSILNLFGLLPYGIPVWVPAFLSIGIWPILMGATQWVQMKLNPAPADPIQARMFNWMPFIFTFMFATFPAGLVIYYAWNNLLTIVQQYVMMRSQNVPVHLFENLRLPGFLKRSGGTPKPTAGE